MAKLSQGLGLDLPDALTRHFKVLPDFLQGVIGGLPDPEPFPQHFFFTRREGFQGAVDLTLQVIANGRFQR